MYVFCHLLPKSLKKKVIVIDDIVSIHVSDRTAIGKLIKLLRPKKTKRQKSEEISMVPILCINHYYVDKKIKELMKVCACIEMKPPTTYELIHYAKDYLKRNTLSLQAKDIEYCVDKSNKNINKLRNLLRYRVDNNDNIYEEQLYTSLRDYNYVNIKDIVQVMFHKPIQLEHHYLILNETDRTSISMLIHENMIDHLQHKQYNPNKNNDLEIFENYSTILKDICTYDYIDRVTFQKQIWVLNELNSINKNVTNVNLYYDMVRDSTKKDLNKEPRFTKVLTKYSTEYNNHTFLTELSHKLHLEPKDIIGHFIHYRKNEAEINYEEYNKHEVSTLDVNRMIRFVNVLYE